MGGVWVEKDKCGAKKQADTEAGASEAASPFLGRPVPKKLLITAALFAATLNSAFAAEITAPALGCHDRDTLIKMIEALLRNNQEDLRGILSRSVRDCREFQPGQTVKVHLRDMHPLAGAMACIEDESAPSPKGCYWTLGVAVGD